MDDQQQQAELHAVERLNAEIGKAISHAINKTMGPNTWGFALFMFSFGSEGAMTYCANAERQDIIKALKEFIEKVETGTDDELNRRKRI